MLDVANPSLWLLLVAIPSGLAVAYTDLRDMKIYNVVVYATVAGAIVLGLLILPISEVLWRALNGVIAFAVTWLLFQLGRMGGGDAKYIPAMVPFFAPVGGLNVSLAVFTVSATFLAAFFTHRILKRAGWGEKMCAHWASWHTNRFPGGLALGPALIFYLILHGALVAYGRL